MNVTSTDNSSVGLEKWTPRQVFLATLFVVAMLVSIVLLYRFRTVVLMLFVAILIGTGLKPGVNFLAARGLSRTYGQILIYAVMLTVFLGVMFLALPPFLEQSNSVTNLARKYYNDARVVMITSQSTILRNLGVKLSPNLSVQELATGSETKPLTPEEEVAKTAEAVSIAFQYAGMVGRTILIFVAIFLMAFYWTLEAERAIKTLLLLFPPTRRESIREVIEAVEGTLGNFLFGEGLLLLAVGSMSLIAYLLIGLPNALVLALIAGIMEAVPMIGPALGAVPAILVAASTDPGKIIWVVLASIVIQQAENHLLVPRVMDRSVGVNPLLTILSIATLSSLMGLPGALLAVPIAAIFQFLINRFVITPMREPELKPEGRDRLSYLRLQTQEIASDSRKLITTETEEASKNRDEERIMERIETLANDLDQILAQLSHEGETQG